MQRIGYALIGCGRIAPNHLAAAVCHRERLELLAVADTAPENCDRLLGALPGDDRGAVRKYADHREMLREVRPQLAAIATPSGSHAEIALDCIRAGCHALSLGDADRILAAAREKGVWVSVCHQNRFNKSIQRIRAAVEGNRFGRMLHGAAHIRWNRGKGYYDQAPWRGTWAEDGGCLMNQCIHDIDLLRWMMGDDVDEVFAYTAQLKHPYLEAEDLGIALVRFGSGAYGVIEGTVNVYPKNLEETLYLFGDAGTVKAGGRSVNVLEEWSFADGLDDAERIKAECREDPPNIYGFGHTPLYADVIEAIEGGRCPRVDGEAGRRALELVLAIYESAREGRPVKLPLAHASTLDSEGRFGR